MKNAKEMATEITKEAFDNILNEYDEIAVWNALVGWENDVREDQRKQCRDEWYDWFLHGTDSVVECENKILNAGRKIK